MSETITYEAEAIIAPLRFRGSQEDCETWAQALLSNEVFAFDQDGRMRVIGVVTRAETRRV